MAIKLEKLLTKNVLISLLVGILIIAGSFWSRLADSSKNNSAKDPQTEGATIFYQKNPVLEAPNNYGESAINTANLPNVNGLDTNSIPSSPAQVASTGLTPEQKFWLTPSPSTLPYEEITDKSTLYPNGVQKYKPSDIQMSDTNRASLIAYGKDLVKALNGYPYYTNKTPTEITLELSKKFSDANLQTLKDMGAAYETNSVNLIKMVVPGDIANRHVDLANSLERTAQLIENMSKIQQDPLWAINSARQFIVESDYTLAVIEEINKYFEDNKIDLGKDSKLTTEVRAIN